MKMEELVTGSGGGNEEASDALGKRVSSCSVVDVIRSERELRVSKLISGGCECSVYSTRYDQDVFIAAIKDSVEATYK